MQRNHCYTPLKHTSIPLQLALDFTEPAINNSTLKLPLGTDDLMDLLNLWLTSTYFHYNSKHHKQLHETAMGSPVSVVVGEIVMENNKERALITYKRTLPLWLHYVDDTFTAVHKDEIDDFHEHLNRLNAYVQFTKEIEKNGKMPILDCLVTRDNDKATPDNLQKTDTYRQTTQPIILAPNFSQSYDYADLDKTCATSLWLTRQLN